MIKNIGVDGIVHAGLLKLQLVGWPSTATATELAVHVKVKM
jgi:hypothetical protein